MALTVMQYADQLKARQAVFAKRMGLHIATADSQTRVLVAVFNATLAALIRLLVVKGVVTDAELAAAFDVGRDEPYEPEPVNPRLTQASGVTLLAAEPVPLVVDVVTTVDRKVNKDRA